MEPYRVLSLGAGVQSSAMLLMAAEGRIQPPDIAIFADTGYEPQAVYDHLAKLMVAVAPTIDVVVVKHGNIRDDHLAGRMNGSMPFFVGNPGERAAPIRRQCTGDYKVDPLTREAKRRAGKGRVIEMALGISVDEIHRAKASTKRGVVRVFPLLDLRWKRADCAEYLRERGWDAPRSACIACPYHSDNEWRRLRDQSPREFADAVEFEREMQSRNHMPHLGSLPYLHRSLIPLDQVDLSTPPDRGQLELWTEECEGMCAL